MSVLLFKLLWTRTSDGITINITDGITMSLGRSLDIKNNVLRFDVKNSPVNFLSDGSIENRYVDLNGNILFNEEDQFKLYANYSDDMTEIEDSVWSNDPDNTTEPDASHLRGIYYLKDYDVKHTIKGTPISITCADKTFLLFNKLWAEAFPLSQGVSAPEIIQKLVLTNTQNSSGEYAGPPGDNQKYDIQGLLDTEGGHIQSTRKATYEDGSVNPDTVFPDIAFAKVWKPLYEWVQELSEIENLNTGDELQGNAGKKIVYGRPFLYFVDEDNKFHWTETNDVITTDANITIGETLGVISVSLAKSIFDVINFVVFRGGEDLFGKGTLNYDVDITVSAKNIKMRVVAMTDLSINLIEKEIQSGNLVINNVDGVFTFSGNRYDSSGYPLTPEWSSDSVANDEAYNDSLIAEIIRLGRTRAKSIIAGLSDPRWKGSVVRKGSIYSVGDLFVMNDSALGVVNQNLRIVGIVENFTKTAWTSTLEIEQDQDAIVNANT